MYFSIPCYAFYAERVHKLQSDHIPRVSQYYTINYRAQQVSKPSDPVTGMSFRNNKVNVDRWMGRKKKKKRKK